ncbi:MAG TPA: hypothetical protein VJS13_02675 [Pyrinomonadaceae bacterium]|nr:hypothetical protein [Pyrinomonadaceae bacterium]
MGFWKRQFGPNRTGAQDVFDVTFGLVLPILCFIVDPVVFKSLPVFAPALLGDYQLLAYVVSTVEMGFFLVWRTFPHKVNWLSPLFAGVFIGGACFSLVIGIVILPATVVAMLFVIGILGLMPFFSAFVYLRNGIRAMKAQANLPLASRITTATLSGVPVIGALIFASLYMETSISASIGTLIYGNAIEAEAAGNRLKWFRFIPGKEFDRLAVAYGNEWDPQKRAMLGRVYWELTGEDLGLRQRMLDD